MNILAAALIIELVITFANIYNIHAACIASQPKSDNVSEDDPMEEANHIINYLQPSHLKKSCGNSISKNLLLADLHQLNEDIKNEDYTKEELDQMRGLFSKARALAKKEKNVRPNKVVKAWNKKRDRQPRFESTKKSRPFDATAASISNPTRSQIFEIKETLSNDFSKIVPHVQNTFDHYYLQP